MTRFFSYNTRQFTATSPPFTAIHTSYEYGIGQNPFTGNSDCKRKFKVEKALVNGVFMQKQARKAQNFPKSPKIAQNRACGATLVNGYFRRKSPRKRSIYGNK
jgi:hypothetical protein